MQAHEPILILCSHKGEEEYQVDVYTYVGDNKQEIMMVHCVEGIHTLSLPVH